jgi:nucleotide-binding universal stress UspA family protein
MPANRFRLGTILCPTDFSVFSDRALRHAVALAGPFHARLEVAHVIPRLAGYRYYPASLPATEEMRAEALDETRRFAAPAVQAGLDVSVMVREGDPWREILGLAEERNVDLTVLGTHGRGGLERFMLGSVTEKLLRRLPCPILTVCHEEGRTWQAPGLLRRVLCATDLSPSSREAVDLAVALAAAYGARVTLAHVLEPIPPTGEPLDFPASYRQELQRRASQELHDAAETAEVRHGVEVDGWMGSGRPAEEIVRLAVDQQVDLLVIGQGRGALDRLLFGSNAHAIVREATCPVLVARPLRAAHKPGPPHELVAVKAKG